MRPLQPLPAAQAVPASQVSPFSPAAAQGDRAASAAPELARVLPKAAPCACGGGCPKCGASESIATAPRRAMEKGFGRDFSQIRIHTDSVSAGVVAQNNALAATSGRDIAFAPGQYRPDTPDGLALLAHELAHTVHQEGADPSSKQEDAGLEQDADFAAKNVMAGNRAQVRPVTNAPQVQFAKVSQGGFGQALEGFTDRHNVSNQIVRMLRRSPTFMRMAGLLDRHYFWNDLQPDYADFDSDDRLLPGANVPRSMVGKRSLMVIWDDPSFQPLWSPDHFLSSDLINLNQTDRDGFISQIAHEASHAVSFLTTSGPAPATIVAEVEAGIQDEVATRQTELTVLNELRLTDAANAVESRDPAEAERDISPALGLPYLESFVFGARLNRAMAADGLSDTDATEVRERVERAERSGLTYPWEGQYGRVWRQRLEAKREWAEFQRDHDAAQPRYQIRKEMLLQDHASRFFEGGVSYRPRPGP